MGFLTRHAGFARSFIVAATVVCLGVGALLARGSGSADSKPRDVVLVVRDMAFYLDGTGGENPTLRLRSGERVRLVLKNEQPGVTHDFAVSDWKVATRRLQGGGEDAVTFRVPDRAGRYEYLCNPHASMMRGIIEVE
ncbi:MAG TPA: plastocyanin/azurin family copper-binding protein [Vicinamibacterales bacterium]|jgi:plastocyanin|nr:plastocyanin/azurin family copper-binding protein [Vicinamibacterales bacterium]